MIALIIGLTVMGSALLANRVVQQNSQVAEVRVQQEAIINETVGLLQVAHHSLRQLNTNFSAAFSGYGVGQLYIAPYRSRLISQTGALTERDTVGIKWCATGEATCANLIDSASPNSGDYRMVDALNISNNGAETLAFRKGANNPQVYDFTYLPATGNVLSSTVHANSNYQDWDFYRRRIILTPRTTPTHPYTGYLINILVWPVINGSDRIGDMVTRSLVLTDL
jgi:hypothetical protein